MSLKIKKRVKLSPVDSFFNKPRNEKANHEFCHFKSFVASSRMCIWSMFVPLLPKLVCD